MTEAEWLTTKDAYNMIVFLREHGRLTGRKADLLWVAEGRLLWDILPHDACRRELEVAERLADGLATRDELDAAHREAQAGIRATYSLHPQSDILPRLRPAQGSLLRDIFGNPFRQDTLDPAWLTPAVVSLAQTIYDERAFERMPELADALDRAGCTNSNVLEHCRGPGPHLRGCWVVDLLLGKS